MIHHPFPFLNRSESVENPSMARRVVDVLVPVALDRAYSYRVPDALELAPGDIVSVPLGAREATAVVWAENPKPNPRLDNRLKDVEEKLDVPPLKPELRSFVDWVANYTVSSRGMVLRMCLRMGEHLGAERERVGVRLAGVGIDRHAADRIDDAAGHRGVAMMMVLGGHAHGGQLSGGLGGIRKLLSLIPPGGI